VRRVVALLVLLAAACSGTDETPRPPSDRVVYRDIASDGAVSTTTVDVSPPYRARVVTVAADGTSSGFAWDEGALYSIGAAGATRTAAVAPGFPGPYSALQVSLPVAEQQHLVQRLSTSQVLGRACTQWLSREPLDSAPFALATQQDRTTSCVDAQGHVLAERWEAAGAVVRTRVATEVGPGPSLTGAGLLPGSPAPLASGAGSVVREAPRDELARLLQVPVPAGPPGFSSDRSAAVVEAGAGGTGLAREAAVLTWRRGTELAVLRLERDLSGTSKGTVRGAAVDLGALGAGRLEPVLPGLRVVVDRPGGLRVTATAALPEAALLAWVRGLQL